jgi:hypothetical protein
MRSISVSGNKVWILTDEFQSPLSIAELAFIRSKGNQKKAGQLFHLSGLI